MFGEGMFWKLMPDPYAPQRAYQEWLKKFPDKKSDESNDEVTK